MTKEVRKAIMIRSKLRNKFLKDKNEQSRNDYRKKRNFCVALVRRAKQEYFSSLDLSLKSSLDLSLTEDGKTITEDLLIAEIFNNYFSNVIRSLCDRNVPTEPGIACSQNTVFTAINKFRNHPRILSINKNMKRMECPSFSFEFVSLEETFKEVNKLSIKKASQTLDIPVKITKGNKDLISYSVYHHFKQRIVKFAIPKQF